MKVFEPPRDDEEGRRARDLARCKHEVYRGWPCNYERMAVGLQEIRERKLWKDGGYRSMSDMCEGEWGFQERYAVAVIERMLYGDGKADEGEGMP